MRDMVGRRTRRPDYNAISNNLFRRYRQTVIEKSLHRGLILHPSQRI